MNINVTRIDRLPNGMIQFYNGSDVVDSFNITSSVSIGFEDNVAKTIVFSNSVKTISFNVFNLTTLYGATSSKLYSEGIDPSDTSTAYISRLYDIYGFLISDMVQGCCPGPTFVGGVVAVYPDFASFPATGQQSVIYIDEGTNQAYFWDGTSYQLLVSTGVQQYASFALFPVTGSANVIYIDMSVPESYVWDGTAYESLGGGSAVWGGITGTLSAQTDLQAALDAKFDDPTGTTSEYIRGDGTLATFPTITSGTVTSVGTTGLISGGPITGSGTITTSMATNKLVGRSTVGTGIMEEITIGSGLTLTGAGILNNTATPTPIGYYGAFQDNTTQLAAVIDTPYAVKLNTTDLSNGITIVNNGSGNPTRITIANTGIYNIQFSLQLEKNGGSGNMTADIWLRKNGVDIPSTTGKVVLTGSVRASPVIAAWNYVLDVVGGDYYELMWAVSNIHVEIFAEVATPPHPATPSAILTVTQQSGIMAGTGITAINSLTGAVQTLATGTSGTDFGISSATSTHTFNLPTASATNRGALSSADWTTFNSKVPSTRNLTINGSTQNLSADRTFATGYAGFKYNVITAFGYPPPTAPIAGQAVAYFLDDGGGGYDFGAFTIHTTDANGFDIGSVFFDTLNLQPITLFTPSGNYLTLKPVAITAIGSYIQIDFVNYVGLDPLTLNGLPCSFDFGTSIAALVSGSTIKTINGASVLGSGNLVVSGSNIYNADGSLTGARTLTLNSFALTILGTSSSRFHANGNLGIGTTTDAGYKLDVNGTARFVSDIRSTTGIYIGTTATFAGVFPSGTAGRETINIRSALSTTDVGTDIILSNSSGDAANTTSNRTLIGISRGFNPTSGSGVYNLIQINPTINQTGGANGITRGLFINPTLTAAADFRALETNNGRVVIADTATVTGTNGTSLLDLSQTWNTTGTPSAIKLNITDTASNGSSFLLDLRVANTQLFGVTKGGFIAFGGAFGSTGALIGTSAGTLNFYHKNTTAAAYGFDFRPNSGSVTATSGESGLVSLRQTFAPTSGTGVFNAINLSSNLIINQTGGASGITRGLYVNPTLTAAADFRAIEVASGITILGAATTAKASLRIPSGTAPTSPVDGDIWFDGTTLKMRIGGVTRTFTII